MKKPTKNTIVTITGPTCSGKSTLAQFMARRGIPEVRSFTTRQPRPGEVDGQHYDFLERQTVKAIPKDQLIELIEFKGNLYGNTVRQLEEAWGKGKGVATVVVEPHGVLHWNAAAIARGFNHYSIYLDQTRETLIKRFVERMGDNLDVERLRNMIDVEQPLWPKAFDYDLIVPNLGASGSYSDITSEMLLGYITLAFGRR